MKTSLPKVIGFIAIFIAAAMLFGCASSSNNTMAQKYESKLNEKEKMINALRSESTEKDKIIGVYKKELALSNESAAAAEQRAREAAASRTAVKAADSGNSLFPPGAEPGECWARVFIAPTYRTVNEQVLKQGQSERLELIPAQYGWEEQSVLVKEASERMEIIPAKYQWVEEKVLVKPESKKLVEVPAKYEMQQERVLVKAAHTVWKKGRGPIEKIDQATGEIMCLVEVPAIYKTVSKRVMVSPPATKELFIPAEYTTLKKRVMVEPPKEHRVIIPAEYKTVKVRKMISPAKERKIAIPAEYQTITRTEMVDEGHMEWRRILCETNVNSEIIKQVQLTLRSTGHDPGRIDGVIGRHTGSALKSYQRANNLGEGGLTYETLRHMKIGL
jgi:regulator of extracellular matrix RemA (YlzA/DUF370 family)